MRRGQAGHGEQDEPPSDGNGEVEGASRWFHPSAPFYFIAVAIVALALIAGVIIGRQSRIANIQTDQGDQITQLNKIVFQLDHNQKGIDRLNQFVDDLQNNAAQQEDAQKALVQAIIDTRNMLCITDDPVRKEFCQSRGIPTSP